jgi:hypothetical protein
MKQFARNRFFTPLRLGHECLTKIIEISITQAYYMIPWMPPADMYAATPIPCPPIHNHCTHAIKSREES